MNKQIRYRILDPNGNITALVESAVPVEKQPSSAEWIMQQHPEVEQVGFVRFLDITPDSDGIHAELRMTGGEFCGNASLSTAALYLYRQQGSSSFPDSGSQTGDRDEKTVRLRVSGSSRTVEVRLREESPLCFKGSVLMPPAIEITRRPFICEDMHTELPLVRMEGISHIIIESASCFFDLVNQKESAVQAVKNWCAELSADGLGLMFLDALRDGGYRLTPLVYVPGSGTVFWENSCASGSAAAAMYLAEKTGREAFLSLTEPGGMLCADCDPATGRTLLHGNVRLL